MTLKQRQKAAEMLTLVLAENKQKENTVTNPYKGGCLLLDKGATLTFSTTQSFQSLIFNLGK